MRKIAIVGRAPSTREQAPFHDLSWGIWALAIDRLPRYERIFEIHEYWRDIDYFRGETGKAEHLSWLAGQDVPVYMRKIEADVPRSVRYPIEAVGELTGHTAYGGPYLESSIAYMFALAVLEGADRVGLWGVDLSTEGEYAFQRPNLEYLVGIARGRGMKVFIPGKSALFSHARGKLPYGYLDLRGT